MAGLGGQGPPLDRLPASRHGGRRRCRDRRGGEATEMMISAAWAETEERRISTEEGLPAVDGGGKSRPREARSGVKRRRRCLKPRGWISEQGKLAEGIRAALGREDTPIGEEEEGRRKEKEEEGSVCPREEDLGGFYHPPRDGSPPQRSRRPSEIRGRGSAADELEGGGGAAGLATSPPRSSPEEPERIANRDPLFRPSKKRTGLKSAGAADFSPCLTFSPP